MKKILLFLLVISIFISTMDIVKAESAENKSLNLSSKSAVLIEASTGKILYEKEKDMVLNPASITKIMTLILIYEEIDKGTFGYDDIVTVSAHAASMGGSQVFLEENETQTVKDMIKCITIASANDAAVAMSEFVAGSETEFVNRMNNKAKELGMKNTNFVNCCGLDVENHYSTAYDVALMSKELLTKHPEIKEFTTKWMDSIIHKTKKGDQEFGLTNTNKLVRTYRGITGLKTGSTNLAKYCLAASANRDDIELIAVVMSAPEHKLRYTEAASLLDYGFANCYMYKSNIDKGVVNYTNIYNGTKEKLKVKIENQFSCILSKEDSKDNITYKVKYNKISAPIKKNQKVGEIIFYNVDNEIGKINILADENIEKARFVDYGLDIIYEFLNIK